MHSLLVCHHGTIDKLVILLGVCTSTFESKRIHLELDELENESFDVSATSGVVRSTSLHNASMTHGNASMAHRYSSTNASHDTKILRPHAYTLPPLQEEGFSEGVGEVHAQHQASVLIQRAQVDLHAPERSVSAKINDAASSRSLQKLTFIGFLVFCVVILCGAFGLYCSRESREEDEEDRDESQKTMGFSSNGSVKFLWSQTPHTVTMCIEQYYISHLNKSNIDIGISSSAFKVGKKGDKQPLFREEVFQKVDPEKSSWRLRSSGDLEIDFHKTDMAWWDQFLHDRDESPRHKTSRLTVRQMTTKILEKPDVA